MPNTTRQEDEMAATWTESTGLVDCVEGCGAEFFHVEARGERAAYCLDHADQVFGTRPEVWERGVRVS
jgi:hypothetical protein